MSPIPDFDHNNVLPPHLGSPAQLFDSSPYKCTILELCQQFATSKERIEILKGFIAFRKTMNEIGILHGFQWLDGSFLENIEISESRAPNDLDLVTFYSGSSMTNEIDIRNTFPEFGNPELSKTNFKLDHYPFDYTHDPNFTVEYTRYWLQLFTHKRNGIWKGILQIPINTPNDDEDAMVYLNNLAL